MTSIHTNVGALVAQRGMDDSMQDLNSAMNRLSTGYRINSAADDAAGSAIASKFEAQTRSLGVAIRNANDAVSLTQTAEGALGEVENILQRMRELSVQAGNSTLNSSDRAQIQAEINALAAEIDAISTKTNFNQVNLLDGTNSSVTMQIGIDKGDGLEIALQKTDASTLGIGSSSAVKTLTSERMTVMTADTDYEVNDIKINGVNFVSGTTALDTAAISHEGGTVSLEAALDANSQHAGAVASAINTNSANHGAVATAFNKVVGASSAYRTGGTITVNDITIANNSKQEFVDGVNNGATGVQASINDEGKIVFENTDGDTIHLTGADIGRIGHIDGFFGGFVQLVNADGSDVTIEAGNVANGFGATATEAPGTVTDLQLLGFNHVEGSTVISAMVTTTALTAAMNVKINGVAIGASANDSAAAKAEAINAANAGVTATARTEIRITVDDPNGGPSDATINGITVDLSAAGVAALSDVVTTINTTISGQTDIVASANSAGELVLVSESGQNILVDDGGDNGGFFESAVGPDGIAITLTAGVGTAFGILTLTSDDGSQISLEDGETQAGTPAGSLHAGLDTLGLQAQSEQVDAETKGLNVGSVANATAALSALDTAIETVSTFRAGFGAVENRLDSAISNLTTYKTNLEASQGRITDADFASETSKLTKAQILQQAATSMLAQANASKQGLLALLQG